ncbi:MAG TPA: UDP-N-acetylglucosamine 2-epimerase (non-hydrolyzing) [Candidatus Angelobacter sp.]
MKILHIVGARPNFMKVAPVYRALSQYPQVDQKVVHTGQHYDFNMSDVFFQQLGLGAPDFNLQVGSGSHAQQTAEIMLRFEPLLLDRNPDLVLVYGDVNSTVAAALVCSKLKVRVGHVEAGLRSFDRSMPEEINRLLTDQLSDLLFTPSEDGNLNLAREGVAGEKVHLVGNVMIDTLVRMLPAAERQPLPDVPERFALITLHRPANVDDSAWLEGMLKSLQAIGKDLAVVFPVHPRTRQQISKLGFNGTGNHGLILLDPLPYVTFLALQRRATVVITDSGGIQEETTYLGTPCLTVRENTERPITVQVGTNMLVGRDPARMRAAVEAVLQGHWRKGDMPSLWDGHAAERIAAVIMQEVQAESAACREPAKVSSSVGV